MAKQKIIAKKKQSEPIKLTKQQKIRVAQILRLENRISVCREYIQLWSKFFQFFAEDIQNRNITPEEEKAFFQTITALSRKGFLFTELMSDAFSSHDRLLEVLTNSVSLANIKTLDEATLSKLELDWHATFLDMNVALGRLLRKMPAGMNINEMIAHAEATAKADREGIKRKVKAPKVSRKARKEQVGLSGKA